MSDFKLVRYRIRTKEERYRLVQPFTAILLSDLHNAVFGDGNERLLQAIRNEKPELIFVAGDMVTSGKGTQTAPVVDLMNELTKQYYVYYVNGNHESRMRDLSEQYRDLYESYSDQIRSFGVHLLENTGERVEIQKMPLHIWGLELPWDCYRKFSYAPLTKHQIGDLLGDPDEDCFNILLAHHPLYFESYAAWGADLTLAGHLHGGIVRVPGLGGLISPQLRPFPRYDHGLYRLGERRMVVSAGLGSHTIPLRVNNPPELVVLDFT